MEKFYVAAAVIIFSAGFFVAVDPLNSNKISDQIGVPEEPRSSILNLKVLESSNYSKFSQGEQVQLEVNYYTSPKPPGFLESLHNLSEGERVHISTQGGNWTSEFISRETKREVNSVDQKIYLGNSERWNQTISFLPQN